jgi:hypothetical protein
LDELLEEGKVYISYSPRFRQYAIDLKGSNAVQTINYCPWCGDKLPDQLRNRWFDELEALGFDDPFEQSRTDSNFPEEYNDETWWKFPRSTCSG